MSRALKQAVRRNLDRFPGDFMFELTGAEVTAMVSQNVIPGRGKLGGARPMAFTEQGVAMLSRVLRSPRAVQVTTLHVLSQRTGLPQAVGDLQAREGTTEDDIGFCEVVAGRFASTALSRHPQSCDRLRAWALGERTGQRHEGALQAPFLSHRWLTT